MAKSQNRYVFYLSLHQENVIHEPETQIYMKYAIRKSTMSDVPTLLLLADEARQTMRKSGNTNQWINGYPDEYAFANDISHGHSYVVEDKDTKLPYGTFAFIPSPEPTYATIYQGEWLDTDNPYFVIHRIASSFGSRGVLSAILEYCFTQTNNIRIDTHRDNCIMRHLLEKYGFTYCGIIYLANGDERLAFQKINNKK